VTRAKQDLDTTEEMIEHKRNAIESVKDWAALLEQDIREAKPSDDQSKTELH
jgi:hypothetical protein